MTFALSAFVMGLFASGHCLGMCGPLVLALPQGDDRPGRAVFYRLIYNIGRVFTYAGLGLIAGLVGAILVIEVAQAQVARIAGVALILVAVLQLLPRFQIWGISHFYSSLSRYVSPRLKSTGAGKFFILGGLNGFLPCGMVAAALVVSVASETPADSVLYMAIYGLGTLPMMLTASLMGFYLAARTRRVLSVVGPVFGILLGILLIVRPELVAPHCR